MRIYRHGSGTGLWEEAVRPIYWPLAIQAVQNGALSNRAIAKAIHASEASVRRWRQIEPEFSDELDLHIAIVLRQREEAAEAERSRYDPEAEAESRSLGG